MNDMMGTSSQELLGWASQSTAQTQVPAAFACDNTCNGVLDNQDF